MHSTSITLPIPNSFTAASINEACTAWRKHLQASYPDGVPLGMETRPTFCRLGQRQIRELRGYATKNPSSGDNQGSLGSSRDIEIVKSEQENWFEVGDKN